VITNGYKIQNVRACVMGIPSKGDDILEKESIVSSVNVAKEAKYY